MGAIVLTVLGCLAATDVDGLAPSSTGEVPQPDGAVHEGPADTPRPSRRSGREVQELLPPRRGDASASAGFPIAGEAGRPRFLQLRSVGGAATLGALVGFGAGHYYAGDAPWGVALSIVDTVLLIGFGAVTFSLHEDIAQNDFIAGESLARGERGMTSGERRLYNASWAMVGVGVVSRAFQAVDAARTASRTNEALGGLGFVPLGPGAGVTWTTPVE